MAAVLLAGLVLAPPTRALSPADLRAEYQRAPLALDIGQPRLSWTLKASGRAQVQTAYQVLVASSESALRADTGDVWDSGKVNSGRNVHVVYEGPPLRSGRCYHWKVRVWDGKGRRSPWSPAARWETALLQASDWTGKWISAHADARSPLLRKEFTLAGKIRRAIVYVYACGWYELRLNGAKVGDRVLAPVNSNYARTLYYDTYEVTGLLVQGGNAIGLWLGGGYNSNYSRYGYRWTEPKRAILQLNVEYADGSTASVTTDRSWKTAPSPITANHIYDGETYDARLESSGWDRYGFAAGGWEPVTLWSVPQGTLKSCLMPPLTAGKAIRPVRVNQPKPGTYIFDLGQNIAGWIRLRVRGPAGSRIVLRHAEDLHADGTLDPTTNRAAKATDTYILNGRGEEVYEPRFTYHGFRYVEVSGWPGVPTLEDIEGRPVHAAVETTGAFTSSNSLLNQIYSNFRWSILNNLMGIPTDTATRDERTPCQMDSLVVEETAIHNFEMDQYYTKWLQDIAGGRSFPVWSGDQAFLPMHLYQYYGDERVLRDSYQNVKDLVDSFTSAATAKNYWADGFGDWCPPGPGDYRNCFSEGELVDTAVYYQSAVYLAQMAGVLGYSQDRARYAQLSDSIQAAFHARYFHPESDTYSSGRQVTSIMPLAYGMVPADRKKAVVARLADRLRGANQGHLDTGIFGTRYLFNVLIDNGHADLAFAALTQTTAPGYGHQISLGATTNWEQWSFRGGMNTHDHAMFAGPGETLYSRLGGIRPASPGYKTIVIRPYVPTGLAYVRSSLQTVMGTVISDWDARGGYTHRITIPANATAEVYVPGGDAAKVTESGVPADRAPGVRFLRMEEGYAVFAVGSGEYVFSVNR